MRTHSRKMSLHEKLKAVTNYLWTQLSIEAFLRLESLYKLFYFLSQSLALLSHIKENHCIKLLSYGSLITYPSLRAEIPEFKKESMGGFPPTFPRPASMQSLNLQVDGHVSPLVTAEGDGLTKLAS